MFFKILLFLIISFKNVESNEPFVVLEYKGNMETQEGLNRENMFIKNQNYSIKHTVKNGESLSGILSKYYGNSGLNMKIVEVSILEMNKHAFVRGNPHFLFAGKKIKIPSVNEIMNLVKNERKNQNLDNSSRESHIYFYGN